MILKGSQRGGAQQLAQHLLRTDENDHVEVTQLRGFMSDDMAGAFAESHAIALGTRCKQFLFSLSVNPPKDSEASLADLEAAIDQAEERLDLKGQPRLVVIHEKNGRRHAHAVWSRIDASEMKAINLSFFKNRLATLSKELYLEHGWELPEGHRENGWKSPLNFTLAEWQQAKRLGLHPEELKQLFQDVWSRSDGLRAFKAGLEDRGYFLAKGDRRGFVALDVHGEVHSVARLTGIKTKELNARLGSSDDLPGVEAVREATRGQMRKGLRRHLKQFRKDQTEEMQPLEYERRRMAVLQRRERAKLRRAQDVRWKEETKTRSARINRGFRGVWDILTGRTGEVRRQNEREAFEGMTRDRGQREAIYAAQISERRALQKRIDAIRAGQRRDLMKLARQVAVVLRDGQARGEQGRTKAPDRGFHS